MSFGFSSGFWPKTELGNVQTQTNLMKLEHLRWTAFKLMYGWEYGLDKSLKWNPDLVAIEVLPSGEREKDSMLIELIPALLRLAWFLQPQR